MASKELIEELAEDLFQADRGEDAKKMYYAKEHYENMARIALSTIFAVLQEPTEGMIDLVPVPYRCGRDWRQDAKATYLAMLNASPLGEQSE